VLWPGCGGLSSFNLNVSNDHILSNLETHGRGCTGRPGRNSGASACKKPVEEPSLLVSCPPNALPLPPIICVPEPPRLPGLPPLPPRPLGPLPLTTEVSETGGASCWFEGATEAGRRAKEASEAADGTLEVERLVPAGGAFCCAPLWPRYLWRETRGEFGGAVGTEPADMLLDRGDEVSRKWRSVFEKDPRLCGIQWRSRWRM
jgi:hypothetical protein